MTRYTTKTIFGKKNKRARWDSKIASIFNDNIQDNFHNSKQQWMQSVKRARLKKGEKSKQRSRKRDNDLMSWMNRE